MASGCKVQGPKSRGAGKIKIIDGTIGTIGTFETVKKIKKMIVTFVPVVHGWPHDGARMSEDRSQMPGLTSDLRLPPPTLPVGFHGVIITLEAGRDTATPASSASPASFST